MNPFFEIFTQARGSYSWLLSFWWIWLAPLSVTLFINTLLAWRQRLFKQKTAWTLLELRMPREVEKSPRAMEQFFTAIHTLRNSPNDFLDKYREGEVTLWFSCEIVSIEGQVRFFIRTPAKHKRILLANFYANYPTIEVHDVTDYLDSLPPTISGLYAQDMDLWGAEVILAKEDAYPIRTYTQFEHIEESMNLDPIAALLEILSRVEKRENLFIQILIRPATDDWKKKGAALVKKLKEEGSKKILNPLGEYTDRPIRTPGETELLKAIELNISKPGFETLIRYVYIAGEDILNKDFARRSVMAALNQYISLDLNSFRRNPPATTDVKWVYWPHLFSNRRLEIRKHRIYYNYRNRTMPEETTINRILSASFLHFNFGQKVFILNTEELATLFHPPTQAVLTGQLLERVPSKKLGPPLGLPIFSDERKQE